MVGTTRPTGWLSTFDGGELRSVRNTYGRKRLTFRPSESHDGLGTIVTGRVLLGAPTPGLLENEFPAPADEAAGGILAAAY